MTQPDTQSGSSGDELAVLLEAELNEQDQGTESAPAQDDDQSNEATAKRRKLEVRGNQCPPHPGFMGGVCIRCGAFKNETDDGRQDNDQDPAIALKYIHHGLEVSRQEAERLRAFSSTHAASSRRLLLVLDLDHTLLNSSRICDIPLPPDSKAIEQLDTILKTQPQDNPELYYLPHMNMWTKLRPGLRKFLQAARSLFELHIFTMGDSDYAAGMANILDPDGQLFEGRVASSRDAGAAGVKDVDVLLGAEDVVLILDDTMAVWPQHQANVLQVERYIFFPMCAKRFGLQGMSYLEQDGDEDPESNSLAIFLKVLTQVHQRFFEDLDGGKPSPDVRHYLSAIRSEILPGVKILFSGVIDYNSAQPPSSNPLWQMAESLGATCCQTPQDDVTHVVATTVTDKVKWARSKGIKTVSTSWLWACIFKWHRPDEDNYRVVMKTSNSSKTPVVKSAEEDLEAALKAAGGGGG